MNIFLEYYLKVRNVARVVYQVLIAYNFLLPILGFELMCLLNDMQIDVHVSIEIIQHERYSTLETFPFYLVFLLLYKF